LIFKVTLVKTNVYYFAVNIANFSILLFSLENHGTLLLLFL